MLWILLIKELPNSRRDVLMQALNRSVCFLERFTLYQNLHLHHPGHFASAVPRSTQASYCLDSSCLWGCRDRCQLSPLAPKSPYPTIYERDLSFVSSNRYQMWSNFTISLGIGCRYSSSWWSFQFQIGSLSPGCPQFHLFSKISCSYIRNSYSNEWCSPYIPW